MQNASTISKTERRIIVSYAKLDPSFRITHDGILPIINIDLADPMVEGPKNSFFFFFFFFLLSRMVFAHHGLFKNVFLIKRWL